MGITVKELMESFEVQGVVVIKQWNEETDTYNIFLDSDCIEFSYDVGEMEIKYLYANGDKLIIEV